MLTVLTYEALSWTTIDSGLLNNLIPANAAQEVVRVRIPSYVGVTISWHFAKGKSR